MKPACTGRSRAHAADAHVAHACRGAQGRTGGSRRPPQAGAALLSAQAGAAAQTPRRAPAAGPRPHTCSTGPEAAGSAASPRRLPAPESPQGRSPPACTCRTLSPCTPAHPRCTAATLRLTCPCTARLQCLVSAGAPPTGSCGYPGACDAQSAWLRVRCSSGGIVRQRRLIELHYHAHLDVPACLEAHFDAGSRSEKRRCRTSLVTS